MQFINAYFPDRGREAALGPQRVLSRAEIVHSHRDPSLASHWLVLQTANTRDYDKALVVGEVLPAI